MFDPRPFAKCFGILVNDCVNARSKWFVPLSTVWLWNEIRGIMPGWWGGLMYESLPLYSFDPADSRRDAGFSDGSVLQPGGGAIEPHSQPSWGVEE